MFQHSRYIFIVLSGQYFGRRHQCPLISVQSGQQKSKESYDRFSGSHISLNKAGHDMAPLHIILYLFPNSFLSIGQIIRKFFQKLFNFRLVFQDKTVFRPVFVFFHPAQSQDKDKEFFVDKTLSCLDELLLIFRKMHLLNGFAIWKKSVSRRQTWRKNALGLIDSFQSLTNRLDYRIVCQAGGQRIDRLHGMEFFFVFGGRIINFRMFHHKPAFSPYYPAPQDKHSALSKSVP